MQTRRSFTIALFMLALVCGQWAYASHTHKPDADHANTVCQICLHGHHLNSPIPATPLSVPAGVFEVVEQAFPVKPAAKPVVGGHHARAPPARLPANP